MSSSSPHPRNRVADRARRLAPLAVALGLAFAAGRGLSEASRAEAAPPGEDAGQAGFELEMQLAPEDQARLAAAAPGPHHRALDPLVGDWDVTYRVWSGPDATPIEYTGTISREWVLGGRFVREELRAPTPYGEYRGIGFLGYDNLDQQYTFVWMQNESTSMIHETAVFDASARTLRSRGTQRDPMTGRLVPVRGEVVFESPERHTGVGFTTAADGTEYRSAEAVLVRRR